MSETNEVYCKNCGLVDAPGVDQACEVANGAPHEWTQDPAFPSNADMNTLLSAADVADIQSLSEDDKARRLKIFSSSMGEMLADQLGKRGEERDAIIEGYGRMIESIVPKNQSPNDFSGSFAFPSAPSIPAMPKLPEPPSPIGIEVTDEEITVVDFSEFVTEGASIFRYLREGDGDVYVEITIKGNVEAFSPGVTAKFLLYLRGLSEYLKALADALGASGAVLYPVPASVGHGTRRSPRVIAAEIDAVLALPMLKAVLEKEAASHA
jgi:hypothetical protein